MTYLLEKEEVCPSSPKKKRRMTRVIFFLSSVESCGGDHDILLEREEVCVSSPKDARSFTMVIFTLCLVESCGGDHGTSSRERGSLSF